MISRLLWLEPFWLLCLAPFILLPHLWPQTYIQPLTMAGLFLFCLCRFGIEGRFMVRTPLNIAGIFLLLCLPIGISIAIDAALAWEVAGYILFSIIVTVASIQWPPWYHHPERLAYVLVVVGLGLSGVSFVSYGENFGPTTAFVNWAKTLVHQLDGTINPNVLAGGLAQIIPLPFSAFIAGYLDGNSLSLWISRAWAGSITVILGAALWLTESRGGYVATVVGLGMVGGLHWPRFGRLWLLALASCLGYFVWGGLVGYFSENSSVAYWQMSLFEGWLDRQVIWTQAWFALQDFPLTGIGTGQFRVVVPEFYPNFHGFDPTIPHAHNLWLQVGMDLGILGLISYLALQINIWLMLRRINIYFNNIVGQGNGFLQNTHCFAYYAGISYRKHRILSIGLCGSFSTLIFHGMIDAVAWGTKLSFTVSLLVAATVLLFEKTTYNYEYILSDRYI